MAKKKSKKSKKKAVAKVDKRLVELKGDGFDTDKLNVMKEEYLTKIKEIRRNRNYYMIERDAIQQYHYTVCQENEELKTQIKNAESEMERQQKAHKDTIQIYLQKVTHLEYEHEHNLAVVMETKEKDLLEEQKLYEGKKQALLALKAEVEKEFQQEEIKHEAEIKQKQESSKTLLAAMRAEHEQRHEKLKQKYQERLNQLVKDLELRRRIEIHEIEERKNSHINKLIENHERSFNDMRKYYNSLTKDNLGLIQSLKDELENLKARQAAHEKTIADYASRNKQLKAPKEAAEKEVAELQEKLKNYQKDKTSLKHTRMRAITLEDTLKRMRREHKELELKHSNAQKECKKLFDTFEDAVASVKKKGEAHNLKLAQHLKDRGEVFVEKKAHFNALIQAANLDPQALQGLTAKLDEDLTNKITELKELRYENAKIAKAHDDLVRVYEAKMRKFGIPEKALNARPFISNGSTAPADLLA